MSPKSPDTISLMADIIQLRENIRNTALSAHYARREGSKNRAAELERRFLQYQIELIVLQEKLTGNIKENDPPSEEDEDSIPTRTDNIRPKRISSVLTLEDFEPPLRPEE